MKTPNAALFVDVEVATFVSFDDVILDVILQGAEGWLKLNDVHPVFGLFQFNTHYERNAGVENVVDHGVEQRAVGAVGAVGAIGTSFAAAVHLAREASLSGNDFVFRLVVRIEPVGSVIVVIVVIVQSTANWSYRRYAVTLSNPLIAAGASAAEAGITHRITSERARTAGAAAADLDAD